MGDFFQTLVDRDAGPDDVAALAGRVVDWLVHERIVEPALTACVLDPDGLGYAPGPAMEAWLDDPTESQRVTRGLVSNGLEVITAKTVFWSTGTEYQPRCPRGHTPPLADDDWLRAVDEWQSGAGAALVACPTCQHRFPLTDWDFQPGFAFGYLGFTFWNWPSLEHAPLRREIERLLSPHRSAFVYSVL